ncbi:hypothetical protein C8R43DRAFT_1122325 [Mycena crocata]|nr:hypothetical protein C8R43DRAFT_1122325 [Mycena crocata]
MHRQSPRHRRSFAAAAADNDPNIAATFQPLTEHLVQVNPTTSLRTTIDLDSLLRNGSIICTNSSSIANVERIQPHKHFKSRHPASNFDAPFQTERLACQIPPRLQISTARFKSDPLRRKISTVTLNSHVSQLKNANSTHFVDSVTPYHCLRSTSSRWMFGPLSLHTGTRSYLGDFNLIHFQVSLMNYLQICLRTHSSQECPSRFKPSIPTIQVWFKFRLKDVERGKGIVEGHTTQVEAITHVETMLQSVVIITAFGTV